MRQLSSALGSRPGLERINSLLEEMGNPQKGLKYIHVAGTNGKGSTSLMIADVLIKAGYRVGRFTSPHLHSYFERFTVNGQEITEKIFKSILDSIEKHIEVMIKRGESHPTEFEILTAVAFQYFKDEKVDAAVLEVGMGGTFDSTNVITPMVSIITGIDFDHTAYLGTTLKEIAANKAGIIKPGVPVVAGVMEDEALEVINSRARSMGAELYHSSEIKIIRPISPSLDEQIINIEGKRFNISNLKFSLRGDYQIRNLAVALTALQILTGMDYKIREHSIRDSLGRLSIPGRMEVVRGFPLAIADAAHNPQGAEALAESLDTLLPGRKKILVFGLVDDKDRESILQFLGRNTQAAIVTRPQGSRGRAWKEVVRRWQEIFPDIEVIEIESITEAVNAGLQMVHKDEYLLVTGSFYVLDEARQVLINN